jgi:DNA polymerase-3 subunit epsilon
MYVGCVDRVRYFAVVRRIPPPPPRSEQRKDWRHGAFAALDFETTGLDFARDRIVSFGVVPIDAGVLDQARAVYDLVDPGPVAVSDVSFLIHGLGPAELRDASSAAAARDALRAALARRYVVTWNGVVEASFLGVLYGTSARQWLRRSIDVRRFVLALLGADAATLTLSQAAGRFGVPVRAPHHALDDAIVTAELFLATARELSSAGLGSIRDALRVGRAQRAGLRPLLPR